jgi:hypothetical protein
MSSTDACASAASTRAFTSRSTRSSSVCHLSESSRSAEEADPALSLATVAASRWADGQVSRSGSAANHTVRRSWSCWNASRASGSESADSSPPNRVAPAPSSPATGLSSEGSCCQAGSPGSSGRKIPEILTLYGVRSSSWTGRWSPGRTFSSLASSSETPTCISQGGPVNWMISGSPARVAAGALPCTQVTFGPSAASRR